MAGHDFTKLKQQDMSHLTVQEMDAVQRAELCRRYVEFIGHFGVPSPPPAPSPHVRKWVPDKRIERRGKAGEQSSPA